MRRQILIVLGALVVHGAALASGGSSMPTPKTPTSMPDSAPIPHVTPEEQAVQMYNDGLRHQDKAKKLTAEADSADPGKRAKIEDKARGEYEKAQKSFRAATDRNPRMFQAWSGLGFALRKTGSYDDALVAYERALSLEPRYGPAIEYRAEAYLSLDRIDDTKSAYMTLFNDDRKRADELHAAMKKWLAAHRQDPRGVSPDVIEDFGKWIAQREEIAGQTSDLTPTKNDRW